MSQRPPPDPNPNDPDDHDPIRAVLRAAPTLAVPRDFTLDPATYGRRTRRVIRPPIGAGVWRGLAAAAILIAAVGLLASQSGVKPTPQVALMATQTITTPQVSFATTMAASPLPPTPVALSSPTLVTHLQRAVPAGSTGATDQLAPTVKPAAPAVAQVQNAAIAAPGGVGAMPIVPGIAPVVPVPSNLSAPNSSAANGLGTVASSVPFSGRSQTDANASAGNAIGGGASSSAQLQAQPSNAQFAVFARILLRTIVLMILTWLTWLTTLIRH